MSILMHTRRRLHTRISIIIIAVPIVNPLLWPNVTVLTNYNNGIREGILKHRPKNNDPS